MKTVDRLIEQYFSAADAAKILERKKKFIELNLTNEVTDKFSSKVGGFGYLPKDIDYPKNKEGKPLLFLAQINFDEMPDLDPFPKQGILSFYIDIFDDLYGLNLEKPNDTSDYRVFYFSDLGQPSYSEAEQESFFSPYPMDDVYKVVQKEQKMVGSISEMLPIVDSVEFKKEIGKEFYEFMEGKISDEQTDQILESQPIESEIGGYPFFTQSDPREDDQELANQYDTLLFQLLSDDDNVMWGDCGVANFFINRQKLQNLDFSDVMYNWDCY